MALEDTMVLYKSSGAGPFGSVLVPRNAAWLDAKLDLGAGIWSLLADDNDHLSSPFSENDYVWIGKEKIKVGSGSNITRAQGGTDDANHPNTGLVLPDFATMPASSKILDITVGAEGNGKTIIGIRCVGIPGPGDFIIEADGVVVATPITSLDHQEAFWPWTGSELSTGQTIEIWVINFYPESLFRAEVIR